jgi:cytochrome c oxidase cbb3-type subunit 3
MPRLGHAVILLSAMAAGCSAEKRETGAEAPWTPPRSASDPRIATLESNVLQLSQGGRYFTWYGCGSCHAPGAMGFLELGDGRWRRGGGFDQIYRAITDHRRHSGRIPVEQLWQITGYVRSLSTLDPAKRRRQDFDQRGEPQGDRWSGPVK